MIIPKIEKICKSFVMVNQVQNDGTNLQYCYCILDGGGKLLYTEI